MSLDAVFDFADKTDTDILGIYEAEAPIGYIVLLKNEKCGYIYFIAIDSKIRSKGYGGEALRCLFKEYPHLQFVLDFEVLDETAKNNDQRMRRKNFYLRNGFHETGNFTMLREDRFEVVCSGGELQKEAFKDLLRTIHKYRPELPDVLL